MGQKVSPIGLRLGINRTWDSRWYAEGGEYGKLLHEDLAIREMLMKELRQAAVSKIVIERPHKKCRVTIHSARPGVVIGKKGADIDRLRKQVAAMTDSEVHINIVEVRKPEIDATLVAQSIAQQLERRVAFRRAMKRAVQSAMRLGAEGIRINCAGRLGGQGQAEVAEEAAFGELQARLAVDVALQAAFDQARAEALAKRRRYGRSALFAPHQVEAGTTGLLAQGPLHLHAALRGGERAILGRIGHQLMEDQELYAFVMRAFDLEDQIFGRAMIEKVLKSNIEEPDALVNRLTDPRFREMYETLGFGKDGVGNLNTILSGWQDRMLDRYVERQFINFAEDQNSAVGTALEFRAKASEMEHAVRSHVRKHLDEDPVKYTKLSERLKEILEQMDGLWQEQVDALSSLIRQLQ